MFALPSNLAARAEPVRTGIIGAGLFGTNLTIQLEHTPGLEPTAVADLETEKAVGSLRQAGVPVDDIAVVNDAGEADEVITAGGRAVFPTGEHLAGTAVDVIVEATGIPEAAARHAYAAITQGTHVVMATVEADTVVGPILARLARAHDVTYSMAYGDQPALIVELHAWAQTVGFEVVAAGKGVAATEADRYGTPADIFDRIGFDPELVDAHGLNARMYNSFYDGTKVAVEMCAVANALGLTPDVPGMHLPTAEIPDIPRVLRPKPDGGILNTTGIVDTITTKHPDGTPVEQDIGFGVFVVTTTPNDRIRAYLDHYSGTGLYAASAGTYQVFHRPYHLPGIETGVSVAIAAVRNEPTGTPAHQHTEVVGAAKRSLEPGERLDGGGGATVYGLLVDADTAAEHGYVPFELLDGATLTNHVAKDDIITDADADIDDTSFLHTLRNLQQQTL